MPLSDAKYAKSHLNSEEHKQRTKEQYIGANIVINIYLVNDISKVKFTP